MVLLKVVCLTSSYFYQSIGDVNFFNTHHIHYINLSLLPDLRRPVCCRLPSLDSFLMCPSHSPLPTGMQYGYVTNSGASSASATTSGPAAGPSSSSSDDDEEEEDEDEEAGLLQLFPPHNPFYYHFLHPQKLLQLCPKPSHAVKRFPSPLIMKTTPILFTSGAFPFPTNAASSVSDVHPSLQLHLPTRLSVCRSSFVPSAF